VALQQAEGNVESRQDVLLVDPMIGAQIMVRDPCEPSSGAYIMGHGDSNRLVHDKPELSEQPLGSGIIHLDSEC